MAAAMASPYIISRGMGASLCVHVIERFFGSRKWTGERELDRFPDLSPSVIFDPLSFRFGQHILLDQARAKVRDWILLFPFFEFGLVAVNCNCFVLRKLGWEGRHGDDIAVGAQAVELRFNQAWSLAAASTLGGLGNRFMDRKRIGPIYRDSGNAKRLGSFGKRITGNCVGILQREMCVGLILVVFQNVHNRQFPDRGQIQRLKECTLFGGTDPEKAENHLARSLYLLR